MNFTILIPHFKNGKSTAYCISQLLKNKGLHELEIIVIDNSNGEGSEYLKPFMDDIKYVIYPPEKLQSHGISFDWVLGSGIVSNEHFITLESDSFPTNDKWLDLYEKCIGEGYELGGSLLQLSGGEYLHPCGSFYKLSVWEEAKEYCENIPYLYFPNMSYSFGFDCHLMVHKDILDKVLDNMEDYIEPAKSYKGLSKEEVLGKADYYKPVVNPFHNGMGMLNEKLSTYGKRKPGTEVPNILLDNKVKVINRIGYEPGQFLFYWSLAMKKKAVIIPTDIKWMTGRENQQQEYTLTANGLKHLWAGSSFLDMKDTPLHDVYEFKKNQIEELYNSLPENQKIK